jgi:DNA-binding IclR family transcriptional regulator
VRKTGAATFNFNMIDGMAGVGVPILDHSGEAVAAFSVGTLASRLTEQRLQTVVELLRREAAIISHKISPFDPSLRQPNQALANRR